MPDLLLTQLEDARRDCDRVRRGSDRRITQELGTAYAYIAVAKAARELVLNFPGSQTETLQLAFELLCGELPAPTWSYPPQTAESLIGPFAP